MKWDLETRYCRASKCKNKIRVLPTSKHWYCCQWHNPDPNTWREKKKAQSSHARKTVERMLRRYLTLSDNGKGKRQVIARQMNEEGYLKISGKFKGDPLDAGYLESLCYRHHAMLKKIRNEVE